MRVLNRPLARSGVICIASFTQSVSAQEPFESSTAAVTVASGITAYAELDQRINIATSTGEEAFFEHHSRHRALRNTGRVLGVVGAGLGAASTYRHYIAGDTRQAYREGLRTAAFIVGSPFGFVGFTAAFVFSEYYLDELFPPEPDNSSDLIEPFEWSENAELVEQLFIEPQPVPPITPEPALPVNADHSSLVGTWLVQGEGENGPGMYLEFSGDGSIHGLAQGNRAYIGTWNLENSILTCRFASPEADSIIQRDTPIRWLDSRRFIASVPEDNSKILFTRSWRPLLLGKWRHEEIVVDSLQTRPLGDPESERALDEAFERIGIVRSPPAKGIPSVRITELFANGTGLRYTEGQDPKLRARRFTWSCDETYLRIHISLGTEIYKLIDVTNDSMHVQFLALESTAFLRTTKEFNSWSRVPQ